MAHSSPQKRNYYAYIIRIFLFESGQFAWYSIIFMLTYQQLGVALNLMHVFLILLSSIHSIKVDIYLLLCFESDPKNNFKYFYLY